MTDKKEIIIYFDKLPIYISIENIKKISDTYMSLCILRNKLIESGFVKKENRENMFFYKKTDNNYIKIKEGDMLDGVIFLFIKEDKDYSESINILYHLEKRIAQFELEFNNLHKDLILSFNKNNIEKYDKYRNTVKSWLIFKEYNNDCFDYNDWYFIMKQNDISLLRKMSLDIKKWICQKEKIISEIDLMYLNELEYKIFDDDFTFINKYIDDI